MDRGERAPSPWRLVSWIPFSLDYLVDGGDYVIALGTVRNVDTSGGKPLTYWRRTFGTHVPVSES
jgi:hypothetical protein